MDSSPEITSIWYPSKQTIMDILKDLLLNQKNIKVKYFRESIKYEDDIYFIEPGKWVIYDKRNNFLEENVNFDQIMYYMNTIKIDFLSGMKDNVNGPNCY